MNLSDKEMVDWMSSYLGATPRYLYGISNAWKYKDWFRYNRLLILLWRLDIRPVRKAI